MEPGPPVREMLDMGSGQLVGRRFDVISQALNPRLPLLCLFFREILTLNCRSSSRRARITGMHIGVGGDSRHRGSHGVRWNGDLPCLETHELSGIVLMSPGHVGGHGMTPL